MSKYIDLTGLSRFLYNCKRTFAQSSDLENKAQVVHINSFWNAHEEGDTEVLIYDHGDVTGTGLKEILDAGNIPYLNVYINVVEEGEEPQWRLVGEAVYSGCMNYEEGNIVVTDFRLNYQFVDDVSLLFIFSETGEVNEAVGAPFRLAIQSFVQYEIKSAIPSVSEINKLFNE